MKFNNKYTDFENNETELTEKELEWFYSVVTKFHQLPEATGIVIVNRNHEELSRKNREAYGIFWTTDPNNTKSESFITIDNFFIHEMYDVVFNGAFNVAFETLEGCIAHEIAHRYKFRHCKTHSNITNEILEKYYSLRGV